MAFQVFQGQGCILTPHRKPIRSPNLYRPLIIERGNPFPPSRIEGQRTWKGCLSQLIDGLWRFMMNMDFVVRWACGLGPKNFERSLLRKSLCSKILCLSLKSQILRHSIFAALGWGGRGCTSEPKNRSYSMDSCCKESHRPTFWWGSQNGLSIYFKDGSKEGKSVLGWLERWQQQKTCNYCLQVMT